MTVIQVFRSMQRVGICGRLFVSELVIQNGNCDRERPVEMARPESECVFV